KSLPDGTYNVTITSVQKDGLSSSGYTTMNIDNSAVSLKSKALMDSYYGYIAIALAVIAIIIGIVAIVIKRK
ncbi:hypothetical protein, partial [Picrophilus oshimae]